MTWVAVGSAVVAIIGGIAGAASEKKKRKGIRQLSAANAIRLESQAKVVERQTEEDLVSLRQQLTRVVGEQRAGWGASGLSGDTGSALDVLAASVTTGINDQRRRKEAGATEAADLRFAGRVGELSARVAIQGSQAAGQASLIQGVGQAAGYIIPKFTQAKPTATKPTAAKVTVGG